MMNIRLTVPPQWRHQGSCDGEVTSVGEFCRSLRRHPNGKSERYVHSGLADAATGYPIFVYAPPRRRGTA
jgi:hypothetical protein